jgi:hypothetical protein
MRWLGLFSSREQLKNIVCGEKWDNPSSQIIQAGASAGCWNKWNYILSSTKNTHLQLIRDCLWASLPLHPASVLLLKESVFIRVSFSSG